MLLVREHLVLLGQERSPGVHEVDARQPVLQRDLLGTTVLLHRHRIVGATLDRGVVGNHQHLAAMDQADAHNDPGTGRLVVVHPVCRQRRDLQERAAIIQQLVDALTRQQLATAHMALPRLLRPAQRGVSQPGPELGGQHELGLAVRGIGGAGGVYLADNCLH